MGSITLPPEDPKNLPPMTHVKEPVMAHMSTRIRWWLGLGYQVKEVSNYLGVRYQQVRNVKTTEPKRAIREDVPPLIIELHELDDDLEAMDKAAMIREMTAQRAQDAASRRKARKGQTDEDEDQEDTE